MSRSVADLVAEAALRALATPSNLRLGREIAAAGGVELVEAMPLRVVAKVSGGQRRTVELASRGDGLGFTCTCSKKPGLFCKHCVALALVTSERSPPARA
jgi:uncharacterized Zn finger protein